MQLTLAPASSDQLSRLRSDPGALAAIVAPIGDADRRTLRHGGVVRLGPGGPVLGFLEHGGIGIGTRARAFRSDATAGIAAALAALRPSDGAAGLDPGATAEIDELGVLLQSTSDTRALLVVRGPSGEVDVHLVADAAIDRYAADATLLDTHLAKRPAEPAGSVVLQAWYALQVGLNELGDSAAHRFVEDGGELLDEETQLRVFDPSEVGALRDVLSAIAPGRLRDALSPRLIAREGLETEEAELAVREVSTLCAAVGDWAANGRAMLSFMS